MIASLVDALLAQVHRTPDQICLIFIQPDGSEQQITYAQLHRDALSCAAHLQAEGVQEGHLVLLLQEHPYEVVTSLWGTIYCGAVPSIMPYYDPRVGMEAFTQRVVRRAQASGAHALVAAPELAGALAPLLAPTTCRLITMAGSGHVSHDARPVRPLFSIRPGSGLHSVQQRHNGGAEGSGSLASGCRESCHVLSAHVSTVR